MFLVAGFSAFAIFLGIAAIGFLFLMVSFVFGEVFGHGDFGGHDADLHSDAGDAHGGVSIFSTRVVSVFVTAFGGFGAIGIQMGYRIEISTAIEKIARSVDGGDIPENALVKVEDIVGETVLVRKAE